MSERLTAEELKHARVRVQDAIEMSDIETLFYTPVAQKLLAAVEENERLRARSLVCSFCGRGASTGEDMALDMATLIMECEKHPMRAAVLENARLRAAIEKHRDTWMACRQNDGVKAIDIHRELWEALK